MSATPVPSAFEARCNAVYDALMWAFSRPGLPRDLPETGQGQIVDALLDRECAVHAEDEVLCARIRRTGAALMPATAADHLFLRSLPDAALLRELRQGSDLHPEDGATLVVDADLAAGQRLRLTGPGVDGALDITIGGLPQGLWQERARAARYPMGVDIVLIDGARVIALPRSTKVEVL